jgi:hypothetical protein
LQAPDFTLPDLDGKLHSLSQYEARKSSWFRGPRGEVAALTCPCGRVSTKN